VVKKLIEQYFPSRCCEDEGWRTIEGYTKYVINKDGIVKNTITNKELLHSMRDKRYPRVSLCNSRNDLTSFSVYSLIEKYFPSYCCEDETWKAIEGFESYQVSSCGRVKNTTQCCIMKTSSGNKNGYVRVEITDGKIRKTCFVHNLVAKHFINNPLNLPVPDHIDRVKTNNHSTNLRWASFTNNAHNRNKTENITSRYYGVVLYEHMIRPKKYKVTIAKDYERYHVGWFQDEEEAARAARAR
jgi:hypothetical protein